MSYKSVYEAIEEQLKAKLSEIEYLKTVMTFGEEDFEEAMRNKVVRMPAVMIVWGGDTIGDAGVKGMQAVKYEFSIIVVDRNLRGEEETRHGYGSENPGLYKIIQDVKEKLRMKVLVDEDGEVLGQVTVEDVRNLGRSDEGYNVGVVEISVWNEEICI